MNCLYIDYEKAPNDKIMKDLLKINSEMNSKYNTYDNLDRLKCIEDEEILALDKKFDPFSIDNNYNYASNIVNSKNSLPNINLDLSKIVSFYNNNNITLEELLKEITSFNKFFESLTKYVTLNKLETVKEKSIVYYLFYYLSRAFFYIVLNSNFLVSKENCLLFTKFFTNYNNIIKTAKLYLKEDVNNTSMIVEEGDKNIVKKKIIKQGICQAFEELKKYPNEFKDAILNCQNFLILILFSSEPKQRDPFNPKPNYIDKDLLELLEKFVITLNVLYKVNVKYSIIDYQNFYNDGMSKNLNLNAEFKNYLKNKKIKKLLKKEKEKEKEKNKGKDEKNDKNEQKDKEDDILELEDEENEEEEDHPSNPSDKNKLKFTLFDYMWLFNPAAKNNIIFLFNKRQKESELMKSVNQMRGSAFPLFGLHFISSKDILLTINIRRQNLIEDTLNEISKPGVKLQNPIRVKFIGEQGVDEGGVRKEFFILFIRQIFDPDYGMFNYNKKTRLYWFNHYTFEPKIKYELIGIILGLAIYNNIILDVKFPLSVYKKLLGIKPTLEDMKECDIELYKNFKFLLDSKDKNLKEELETDFTVTDDKFGEKLIIPLKPNGENILVDLDNKEEYVNLYIDWYFNKSIQDNFNSFEKGFYKVFSRNVSKILSPEELELIICGSQVLDFSELKSACHYEEYTKDSETIKYFWEVLLEFNEEEKKKFLSFVTGCDRAPIDGLGSLTITISNGGSGTNQLPSAHTCFNNLILPNYKNKELLRKKLHIAINYSEGFGLI